MAKAILLFSDGLDSMLAGLLLKEQGIKVIPVRFITPFFGWKYKKNPELFYQKIEELGFEKGFLIDVTDDFLEILKNPRYGYGDYANPCIDCKILMLKKAKKLMIELKADFIATGEVVGQRPMSQNKSSLELIEKRAEVKGILLRPLCAKLLAITEPEKKGLVNREKLLDIYGRRRIRQLELAKKFKIKDLPSPAGGCLLNDPQIGARVLEVIKDKRPLDYNTAQLLTFGRHFLEDNLWIMLGRNQEENQKIREISKGLYPVYTLDVPSPTAVVIQGEPPEKWIKKLLIKYSKKAQKKIAEGEEVTLKKDV